MCRGFIRCAGVVSAPPLGNFQPPKDRQGEATDRCNAHPAACACVHSVIESLLQTDCVPSVARVTVPQKRQASPGCAQREASDAAQEAKKRKLIVKAGPLKAGPEENAYELVTRQTEAAAIPIVQEDTRRNATETTDCSITGTDASGDLSSVSGGCSLLFPLSPEPEWEKILDDLETELNLFTVPTSPPTEEKKESGSSLLSQLLTSQRPVREEYAKIEREPEKPMMSPLEICLPSSPPDDRDSGFQSPSAPGGLSNSFSPQPITPCTPESFSPIPFSFIPLDSSPVPMPCPVQCDTPMPPPYDVTGEFACPPAKVSASDWLFQPVPDTWETPVFSSPTVYPLHQPTLHSTAELLADLIPSVYQGEVALGKYLL